MARRNVANTQNNNRLPWQTVAQNLPADDWENCASVAMSQVTLRTSDRGTRKWALALEGLGVALGLMFIAWLAFGDIAYSSNTPAISSAHNEVEMTLAARDDSKAHDNPYQSDRAKSMEEGFIAAFPFRSQAKSEHAALPTSLPGKFTSGPITEVRVFRSSF